jgi:hypothetical protein
MEAHAARQPWRYNTHRNAAYALEHVRRHFGSRPIAQVTTSDLQAFVTALGHDLQARTVAAVYRFVRQSLRDAHLDGIIGRYPCLRVRLPRHHGGEVAIPTDEEVLALHAAAPKDFAVGVVIEAGIGLRPAESGGLDRGPHPLV